MWQQPWSNHFFPFLLHHLMPVEPGGVLCHRLRAEPRLQEQKQKGGQHQRRVHGERRSHVQEKAERVKKNCCQKNHPSFSSVLSLLQPKGTPRFVAPGVCFLSVQSLCLAWGRARVILVPAYIPSGSPGPRCNCSRRGAATKSEPVGEVPAGIKLSREP